MSVLTSLYRREASLPAWSRFLRQTRRFFEAKGFTEVTTDCIVPTGAVEATLDTIRVVHRTGTAELHTSPEIEMKRLLSAFRRPIYQICKCFRDDPETGIHLKEFSMLEYYRPGATYLDLQEDFQALLSDLVGRSASVERISVREAVVRYAGVDLDQFRDTASLSAAIEARQLPLCSSTDTWNDLFFKLMIQYVEPSLSCTRPTILTNYPTSVSVLANATADPFWSERFEVYWRGLELCNGCTELTDPQQMRMRLGHENEIRQREGKAPHPYPERLLATLDAGLPSCAGVAIGLDRLFTCLESPA